MAKSKRKIIHVDMDAFFAAIEQRDFPYYRGKPIIVGGRKKRGVVSAASYEARKYGIHSAMPTAVALRKCPHVIMVPGRFQAYVDASRQIMGIFYEFTDIVEPVSIDEAYLDVTENKIDNPSATLIAKEIRKRIKKETDLTASAGVSFNKFLAKVASDYDKPDGLFVITPREADKFVDQLPIGKIPGIGKVTEEKMHNLGIYKGTDLRRTSRFFLNEHFGKAGEYFHNLIRFNYDDPVTPERIRKSIGAERTFADDIDEENASAMLEILHQIARKVAGRMTDKDNMGRTVTLKIKYHDFVQVTRSRTVQHLIQNETEIYDIAADLLMVPLPPIKPVRLLGIQVSNLNTEPEKNLARQLTFDFYREDDFE